MELKINVNNIEKTLDVTETKDGYVIVIEGREYRVTDVGCVQGTLAFLVDHSSCIAHVSGNGKDTRLSIGGRNYRVYDETMDTDHPGQAHDASGDGTLEAPMPGNIVAVNVSVGDEVEAGRPVIVLESMKMQNEIVSPVTGVVKKLNCAVGDQVTFGQLLAVIEAKQDGE